MTDNGAQLIAGSSQILVVPQKDLTDEKLAGCLTWMTLGPEPPQKAGRTMAWRVELGGESAVHCC